MNLQAARVKPHKTQDACVFWLHGLGADGYDFVDVVPSLGLGTHHGIEFIFPHAPLMPVTINAGMRMPAWYDIESLDFEGPHDKAGLETSAKKLHALMQVAHEKGVPFSRMIVMGFSQGGALALYTALRYPERLGGCAALSSYLPLHQMLAQERHVANADLPIFIAHGSRDQLVPPWMGMRSKEILQSAGYHPLWHEYPIEHTVSLPELQDIGRWIQAIL